MGHPAGWGGGSIFKIDLYRKIHSQPAFKLEERYLRLSTQAGDIQLMLRINPFTPLDSSRLELYFITLNKLRHIMLASLS